MFCFFFFFAASNLLAAHVTKLILLPSCCFFLVFSSSLILSLLLHLGCFFPRYQFFEVSFDFKVILSTCLNAAVSTLWTIIYERGWPVVQGFFLKKSKSELRFPQHLLWCTEQQLANQKPFLLPWIPVISLDLIFSRILNECDKYLMSWPNTNHDTTKLVWYQGRETWNLYKEINSYFW